MANATEGVLTAVYDYRTEGCWEDRARLLSEEHCGRTGGCDMGNFIPVQGENLLPQEQSNAGAGCLDRLLNFCPWRYLKVEWPLPSAAGSIL